MDIELSIHQDRGEGPYAVTEGMVKFLEESHQNGNFENEQKKGILNGPFVLLIAITSLMNLALLVGVWSSYITLDTARRYFVVILGCLIIIWFLVKFFNEEQRSFDPSLGVVLWTASLFITALTFIKSYTPVYETWVLLQGWDVFEKIIWFAGAVFMMIIIKYLPKSIFSGFTIHRPELWKIQGYTYLFITSLSIILTFIFISQITELISPALIGIFIAMGLAPMSCYLVDYIYKAHMDKDSFRWMIMCFFASQLLASYPF